MRKISLIAVLLLILTGSSALRSEQVYTNNTSDPTTDLIKRLLVEVKRPLPELSKTAYAIKKAEIDYKINPILLIAVMEEELKFQGFPQAHVYLYNLDNGILIPHDKITSLPGPYSDIDRVARALANQIDSFDSDLETSVAAYFFGAAIMKSHGVEDLDQNGKQILINVMNFIRTHPDERRNGTPIKTSTEPKIAKNTKPLSRHLSPGRNKAFNLAEQEFSSIEEKYVAVMRYFNKKLDEETADEIYWAIAQLHSQYPHVDARLVMALFAVESAFRPNAVSRCGAQGLGQLMPYTSKSLSVGDPFDCTENVRGTFAYLDREMARWKNDRYPLDLVLAAYNAGPAAVEKYKDIPPYDETQNYVRKVINIYSQLLLEEEREEKLLFKTRYFNRGYNANQKRK